VQEIKHQGSWVSSPESTAESSAESSATTSPESSPVVHILMATCQGEAFIERQLRSIEDQTYRHWRVYVSDDGSNDHTLDILKAFKARWDGDALQHQMPHQTSHQTPHKIHHQTPLVPPAERVHLFEGPRKGSTENFMHLVRQVSALGSVAAEDVVAFADQDDVWLDRKLERAVAWHLQARAKGASLDKATSQSSLPLSPEGQGAATTLEQRPMLYAAKTVLVDEALNVLGLSKTPQGPLDFKSALVENVLSGNTMVMNKALVEILKTIGMHHSVWHDWSAFLVAAGCNGVLYYDEEPCVWYRQHEKNVIGVKTGWLAQCFRAVVVFKGRYKAWTQINLDGLRDIETALSPEAYSLKALYESVRLERSFWTRLKRIRHLSIRRQNRLLQGALYVGLLLRMI